MNRGTFINFKVEGRRHRGLFSPLADMFLKVERSRASYFTELSQNELTEDIINQMLYALSQHPKRETWRKIFTNGGGR